MIDSSERGITTEEMLEELSLEIRGGISLDTPDRRNHKKIMLAIYRFIKNNGRLIEERGECRELMNLHKERARDIIQCEDRADEEWSYSLKNEREAISLLVAICDFRKGEEGGRR